MVFAVGDKTIDPGFGAGTITGKAHRALVEELEHYYVIKVATRRQQRRLRQR